jgi:hypothetical protein
MGKAVKFASEEEAIKVLGPGKLEEGLRVVNQANPGPVNPCPEHPENERHRDKKQKLLPFCRDCYSQRGKKNLIPGQGCQKGNIVLAFPAEYRPLREWLEKKAEDVDRKVPNLVIHILHQAKKAETGG